MEIEERRVLRRKIPLLEAYLKLNHHTLKSLRDQGLIDKETSRAIQKLRSRRERVGFLVQTLDENATPTTFDKICYYLEKEFLDAIADEMQVELQLEKGKLPLAEYAVKEAKLLAYKLVADYELLAEEDLENIASVLAARYVVARETAKRQKARTVKEEDQDMKSIQEDVTQMYEELQGLFNPMLSFGMPGDEGGDDSGFGFDGGDNDFGDPSIVVTGSTGGLQPGTNGNSEAGRRTPANPLMAPVGADQLSMINNINSGVSNGGADQGRATADGVSPYPGETPMPAETPMPVDPKEQKKSFMKMLNERMRSLSENLQGAVKNYHKLMRERNSCLEVLGVEPPKEGNTDDVSLEDEIKRILQETGYEPKPREERKDLPQGYSNEDQSGIRSQEQRSTRDQGEMKRQNSRHRFGGGRDDHERELVGLMEEDEDEAGYDKDGYDEEEDENATPEELREKLRTQRQKVHQLEDEVTYYREQVEQMSKTRQMGYFYLSWYDELGINRERPRSSRPVPLQRMDSAGAPRRPATTGHSTGGAGARGSRNRWVYYNPDFLDVGDGYVTLRTEHLPQAWSREATAADMRPSSSEQGRGSAQGQASRSSAATGQNKRFNSADFRLPATGSGPGGLTQVPAAGGGSYVNGDARPTPRSGKSVRIAASSANKVYNGAETDSLDGDSY